MNSMPPIAMLWDDSHIWGLMSLRALGSLGFPTRLLKGQDIAQGALLRKQAGGEPYALLVVPGGSAQLKAEALGDAGKRAICDYIRLGGCYLGFCGGAGLALTLPQSRGLGLCPWRRAEYPQRMLHLLSGYVQEICSLAVYDESITENSAVPYGDPWQIMYVFDRNLNTKVVCEAYAKAFQYLCDGTEFDSPWIECHTVSGSMNGIIHMWNIVTMPDGGNYVVDPTNCDEGTLYAPAGGIFLQGGTGDVMNGYKVLDYPYYYDENIIQAYGTGGVLELAPSAYASGAAAWSAGAAAQRSGQEASGSGDGTVGSQEAQGDGQTEGSSQESQDQEVSEEDSLTPKITEKSETKDKQDEKTEAVSRTAKPPNTEDTVVQCLIWGAVLVTAGGTGTALALCRRPRRSRARRRARRR